MTDSIHMSYKHAEALCCVGPHGASEYHLTVDNEFGDYVCRVRNVPYPEDHEFFELILRPLAQDLLQVIGVDAHKDRYRRRGIPDTLLPRMCELLRCRVRSSPTAGESQDQWRTPAATAMWNRLVRSGLASYNKDDDIYWMPPKHDAPH